MLVLMRRRTRLELTAVAERIEARSRDAARALHCPLRDRETEYHVRRFLYREDPEDEAIKILNQTLVVLAQMRAIRRKAHGTEPS